MLSEEEKAEENKGLLAYAIDSRDLSPVSDLEMAKSAIEQILQRHGPKTALYSLPFSQYRYELARHLDGMTKGTGYRPKFVKELMLLFTATLKRVGRPLYVMSPDIVRELIQEAEDLAIIIEDPGMKDLIANEVYAFVALHLNADAYWQRRVHEPVERGEFRRAWDELYRASTGWQRVSGNIRYCFHATPETVGLLARELYSAMQHGKVIAQAGLRQPRQRQQRKQRLLTELCQQDRWFAVHYLREGAQLETATLVDVNQEGLILMHLATHFRGIRDGRRAEKKHTQAKTSVSAVA